MKKNRYLVEYDNSEQCLSSLKVLIHDLIAIHGEDLVVVSFDLAIKDKFQDIKQYKFYRDFLSHIQEITLCKEVYKNLMHILKSGPIQVVDFIKPFYYTFWLTFTKAFYFYQILTEEKRQVLFVVNSNEFTTNNLEYNFKKRYVICANQIHEITQSNFILSTIKRFSCFNCFKQSLKSSYRKKFSKIRFSEDERQKALMNRKYEQYILGNSYLWNSDISMVKKDAIIIFPYGCSKKTHDIDLAIIQGIQNNYIGEVIVFSYSLKLCSALRASGISSFLIPNQINYSDFHAGEMTLPKVMDLFQNKKNLLVENNTLHSLLISFIEPCLKTLNYQSYLFKRLGQEIKKNFNIKLIFSVGEAALPCTHFLQESISDKKVKWISYMPLLISNHPETCYFPADHYLAYGSQSLEVAKNAGKSNVTIVGSINFDRTILVKNERAEHIQYVKKLLKNWENEELIVVGTQFYWYKEIEDITAILDILRKIKNIYVVIKLHPNDNEEKYTSLIKQFETSYKITLLKDCNLNSILLAAKILFCEQSNIIINAASLDTVTILSDFSNGYSVLDFGKIGIGIRVNNINRLQDLVQNLIENDEFYAEQLKKIQSNLISLIGYEDGRTIDRIVESVVDSIKTGRTSDNSLIFN